MSWYFVPAGITRTNSFTSKEAFLWRSRDQLAAMPFSCLVPLLSPFQKQTRFCKENAIKEHHSHLLKLLSSTIESSLNYNSNAFLVSFFAYFRKSEDFSNLFHWFTKGQHSIHEIFQVSKISLVPENFLLLFNGTSPAENETID